MRETRRSRRLQKPMTLRLLAAAALVGTALIAYLGAPAGAATGFANPAFQTQWQQGEAITPNFWGPLTLARDGQMEPYTEATGGMRLVQYFDKARMELTNPATGTVTNGLLATELISGKQQLGDNTFQLGSPATIPVAGDPTNLGPTYASINANSATLMAAQASTLGAATTRSLSATGTPGTFASGGGDANATIAVFDATTQHNVPKAFADYRNKAGLLTIGLAITEPFWSNVTVGGAPKDVLIQAFERRVLTYTPSNPDAFKVEFGNIGQHYYTWRYQSPGATLTPTAAGASATANANATATAAAITPTVVADSTAPKFTGSPKVEAITPNSFTITWTTNEPSSSELLWGTSGNYEQINDKLRAVYTVDHQVVVTGVNPNTTYHYRIQSRDPSGNLTRDTDDRTFTTPLDKNDGSTGAVPKISDIKVTKTTSTTFSVTWTTNVNATSRIEYGSADLNAYDRFRKGDSGDPATTTHTATAISLEPNKIYRFRVVSVAGDNGTLSSASTDNAIKYASDLQQTNTESSSLKLSSIGTDKSGSTATAISFTTDRPASVIVEIGSKDKLGGGLYYGKQEDYAYPFTRTLHTITVGLPPGTFFYRVYVYDEQGTATSDIKSSAVT